MKKSLIIFFLICSFQSFGKIIQVDLQKEKSPVEFEAKGNPSLLSIKGMKGKGAGTLKFADDILSGNVVVDLNDFDTDLDTRNEHMKEKYLETGKPGFNQAILKINSVSLPKGFPEKISKIEKQSIEGTLSLHGKEKKIVCLADLQKDGNELTGKVDFKIKISDYGIEVPSFAGITIEDEVLVKALFKGTASEVIK
jgi:hypothetical protein